MKARLLSIALLIMAILAANGCATVSTLAVPAVQETKRGETQVGSIDSYNYALSEDLNNLILERQPLCSQKAQVIHVKQKILHGLFPGVLEIPLLGLGILDLSTAYAITRATREETPAGMQEIPDLVVCGKFEPAPEKELILQFSSTLSTAYLKTDKNGKVPLSSIQEIRGGQYDFNIFVREDNHLVFVQTINGPL